VNDRLQNQLVGRPVEVFWGEDIQHVDDRGGTEQHRAQHAHLRIIVIGRLAEVTVFTGLVLTAPLLAALRVSSPSSLTKSLGRGEILKRRSRDIYVCVIREGIAWLLWRYVVIIKTCGVRICSHFLFPNLILSSL